MNMLDHIQVTINKVFYDINLSLYPDPLLYFFLNLHKFSSHKKPIICAKALSMIVGLLFVIVLHHFN